MVNSSERQVLRRGQQIVLRHPVGSDEDELLALARQSQEFHRPWVALPSTTEQFVEYLRRAERADTECLLVCLAATGAILGAVNFSQIFYGSFQNAYMGYYVGARYAGQGYMTDGVTTALDHIFQTVGLHRVEANIQPTNTASRALVQRLGFTREGYSRRYLLIEGEWRDHERWAMLAEDWEACQGKPCPPRSTGSWPAQTCTS